MKEEIRITSPEQVRGRADGVVEQGQSQQQTTTEPSSTTSTAATDESCCGCALKIDFQCWPGKKIRATDLASLVSNESHRLESLVMDGVHVLDEFDTVAAALATCRHLKKFDVFSCQLDQYCSPLGTTLAQLPQLVHLCISFSSTPAETPWNLLTPVLENPHHCLRILFVNGFEAPASDKDEENALVKRFLDACGSSTTLQQFTCLPFSTRSFAGPVVVESIERLIETTSSMRVLKLGVSNKATNLEGVAKALRYNHSIHKLDLQGARRPDSVALQALAHSLEHYNFSLKELPPLKRWGERATKEVEFFLSLNQMGRQELLQTSAHEWIETLAALAEDDLSATFYFLRESNASLFSTSGCR